MSDIEYLPIDHLFALNLVSSEEDPLYIFFKKLFQHSRNGNLYLKEENIDPSIKKFLQKENPVVIQEEDNFYLTCNYFYEENIVKALAKRSQLPSLHHNIPIPKQLNAQQKKAFSLLNTSPFFILTGGPGSGKSFVAKAIIKSYQNTFPEKKILCTAPTGKALTLISEKNNYAQTLHKLLAIKEGYEQENKNNPIIADLIIIDECSMISPKIFSLLFSSLLDHTQVILIGDPNQLPPVSGASIFSNMVRLPNIDHINLQSPMRTNNQLLLSFSRAVLDNDKTTVESILEEKKAVSLESLDSFTPKVSKGHIILTPFRKGPFGSLFLNDTIKIHKDDPYPILITKNDPITSLNNGDIGFLHGDLAIFEEKNISLPKLMLPPYEKAYALSIHKSQGSEFDHISLVLPQQTDVFSKELLFTAITRAKKSLTIYGSIETLFTLMKNKQTTSSQIEKKFRNLIQTIKN